MDQNSKAKDFKARDDRPEVELYDPFDRSFSSKKREDPLLRLYDKKIVRDDF